jgi:hypothetical protein
MKALMKGCDITIGIALVLLLAGARNGDDSKSKHLKRRKALRSLA